MKIEQVAEILKSEPATKEALREAGIGLGDVIKRYRTWENFSKLYAAYVVANKPAPVEAPKVADKAVKGTEYVAKKVSK